MNTIDTQQLRDKIAQDNNFILLHVLSEENYEKEHILGSKNIPYDQEDFAQQVENLAHSKETEIVVYCASTECNASNKAAAKLEDAGFTNVTDYEGGMKSWKEANYEIAA
jgi:rhodanese-related sulfurtransferase